jgi:hypothetical protein
MALFLSQGHEIIKKYPHLKRLFFSFVFTPMSIHSTFEASKKLSPDHKSQLKHHRDEILDLYLRYFADDNEPIDQEETLAPEFKVNSCGSALTKALEGLEEYPDIFARLLKFQQLCMEDNLNPQRRIDDLLQGKACFLPHVLVRTPFAAVELESLPTPILRTIISSSKNYREFMLVMDCAANKLSELAEKHPQEKIVDMSEQFITYLNSRVSRLFLAELYEEMRLKVTLSSQIKFLQKTGLLNIFDNFADEYFFHALLKSRSFN